MTTAKDGQTKESKRWWYYKKERYPVFQVKNLEDRKE
jgi:hypothetical protein